MKHWSDGLKVKELQPTVYLKRVNDFSGEKFNILLYVLHILYWYVSVTFAQNSNVLYFSVMMQKLCQSNQR